MFVVRCFGLEVIWVIFFRNLSVIIGLWFFMVTGVRKCSGRVWKCLGVVVGLKMGFLVFCFRGG